MEDRRAAPADAWRRTAAAACEKGGIEALAQLPCAPRSGRLATNDADLLRRLAADKSPKVRLAAVRAIGRSDQLDLMPVLIYAMGDPDGTGCRGVAMPCGG